MFTRVYWFSGTGNSRHVAGRLAEGLAAELVPLTQALVAAEAGEPVEPAERIVLVYPTYAFGPPNLVQAFLPLLPATPESVILAVTTCGGMAGSALGLADAALRRRGLRLAGGWVLRMPENYVPFGGPPPPEKQTETNRRAEERIDAVLADIGAGTYRRPGLLSHLGRLFGRLINRMAGRHWHETARGFAVTEACTRCGTCVRVCPVGNVTLTPEGPVWGERCEACFACLHWCPETAVTHKHKTPRHGTYHHPQVSVADICAQAPRGTDAPDRATT